jgi:hypothetical protein
VRRGVQILTNEDNFETMFDMLKDLIKFVNPNLDPNLQIVPDDSDQRDAEFSPTLLTDIVMYEASRFTLNVTSSYGVKKKSYSEVIRTLIN